MNNKNFFILAIVFITAMCLGACSPAQSDISEIPASASGDELASVQELLEEQQANLEEMTESLQEDLGNLAESLPEAAVSNEFSRGIVDGNVYANEFSGMTFTAPEGYVFSDDDEIAKIFNLTSDYFKIETGETLVYDMYCSNPDTGNSVNVVFENLQGVYGQLLSEEAYMELSMEGIKSAYTPDTGININSIGTSKTDVSGTSMNCINASVDMSGTPFYQTQIVKKLGDYMLVVSCGAFTEEELSLLVSGISFE